MGSDIEIAVQWSKRLEALLENDFAATGKGLHEKIDSVQRSLPNTTVRKLRFVATIRNKIVHETSYSKIADRSAFERTCSAVVAELNDARNSHRKEQAEQCTVLGTAVVPRIFRNARSFRGKANRKIGFGSWSASLSPLLSVVGGIAGFAIPIFIGEGAVLAFFGALIGVMAGFYWRSILTAVFLAFVIVASFWLLALLYHSLH